MTDEQKTPTIDELREAMLAAVEAQQVAREAWREARLHHEQCSIARLNSIKIFVKARLSEEGITPGVLCGPEGIPRTFYVVNMDDDGMHYKQFADGKPWGKTIFTAYQDFLMTDINDIVWKRIGQLEAKTPKPRAKMLTGYVCGECGVMYPATALIFKCPNHPLATMTNIKYKASE